MRDGMLLCHSHMNLLITGGAGYIGAHVVKLLRDRSDHKIDIVDNFSQSRHNVLKHPRIVYHDVDIRDREALNRVFLEQKPDVVFHFAALANVPDSVANPANYYENNVIGSLNLIECMRTHGTNKIIFSSSAAVYGEPTTEEIVEDHEKKPTNPYGMTKLMFEHVLKNYFDAYGIASISFRYFCAAGVDPSLEIGKFHNPETHVIPSIIETVLGKRKEFFVFGDDYPTPDGTGIRDYIHVADLAEAHIRAMEKLLNTSLCEQYNLGINKGFSVLEIIKAVEKTAKKKLNYGIRPRRPGDPARLIANAEKAQKELGWKPAYLNIEDIVKTAYEFLKTKA